MKTHTTSTLRAISSATKTHRTLSKPPSPQELPRPKEHPIFHKPGSIKISSVEDLLRLYPNSFNRLGSLKGEYDIKVDPTVLPVQHARRKVPIESKAAIEEAIDYMVKQDILEPQIEPTPWVSSVTYPVKPTGEVRPCLDARDLNKAIIRENHKPQTVEEITHQLAGAVVFTKADALKAFLQVHLTEESSKLLVINTHKGRYRFKRMPFGAKMSQDVFQMKTDLIMELCPGVISIHDNIVVYGVSEEDHDANLVNLLSVAQIEGLVLNSKKLELKRPRVSFFGAEYSADGMHPCPKKIQGITEMTPPMDKQQLASFIGMVTYMGNFVPHLSHHTEPLRAMLKQEAVFAWDEMANASFQKIKDLIAKSATKPLHYYDQRKPVTVQVDASQRGLGTCLLQDGQPIAYASKSLTDTETRYTNIERELLAIVFACQRFNTYVLGRPFTVESDHKPLEMIHQKSLASAPPPPDCRGCQECICQSQPLKEPLQAHKVPQEPWERIAMDCFYMNGRLYILICDYFSKFPFLFQVKTTSFANLKDHLEELFSVEGIPNEIMSDNGPPFNGKEFSSYLTGLGIRHTTSSPNYPQSNGFIERQIQTVKRLIEKANSSGRSHQEALTGLRAQPLGDGLPSLSEILHGRSLVTRKASPVDLTAVHQSLIALQAKYTKSHDKAKRAKTQ